MDLKKIKFDNCFFCEDAVRVGEDYIEIRHEVNKEEDRKSVDPLLGKQGSIRRNGVVLGRPRIIMTTSYFMHRKCWYEYKLQGRRPKRYKGQPTGANNGKPTLRTR